MTMVSVSVLMAGLMSCLLLAGRILDEDAILPAQEIRGRDGLDRITTDLQYATGFTERTAHSVTCRVPDRDGDDQPETIRYTWSGTAGDPLMITYNGSAAMPLIRDVHQFDLAYDTRTVTGTGFVQGELPTSEPFLINSHVDAPGGRFGIYITMPTTWNALHLEPNVPSGTTSWDFTQLHLCLKKSSNADGYFAIQICVPTVDPIGPSTILQELIVHESILTNQYEWHAFDFDSVTGLSPDQALFIVIAHAQLGGSNVLLGQSEINIDDQPGYAMYTTDDTGQTYYLMSDEMLFYAYGVAHQ
jgi:hypothetical protein